MPNQDLFKAYQEGLRETFTSSSPETFQKFSEHYEKLTSLPRKVRRALQRKWKHSLAVVALIFALGVTPATGAVINVTDGDVAGLRQAIIDANNEIAFPGPDIINLSPSSIFTLTDGPYSFAGDNGLPIITSEIKIEGNGSTIERSDAGATPDFRIFSVSGSGGDMGNLTLNETIISNGIATGDNSEDDGGGIVNYGGILNINNSTIIGNYASGDGGGVWFFFNGVDGSITTITNSTISGNEAGTDGGGFYQVNGTSTITSSNISGNIAGDGGGGIYQDFGIMTIINSTISGNSADDDGGGIYVDVGTLSITNSTIFGNTAPGGGNSYGAGIFNYDGTTSANNTIIAGNSFENSSNNCGGNVNDLGNNLSNDASCGFSGDNNMNINLDPTGLQNNGGQTQTIALLSGSSAIDGVPVGQCEDQESNTINEDQRGIMRPQLSSCDVGAFEFIDQNNNGIDDCVDTDFFQDLDGDGISDFCDIQIGDIAPAPTMSQWGMIAFGFIAGLFGLRFLRKRKLDPEMNSG